MINLQDIRYVRLGTPISTARSTMPPRSLGLQLAAREGKAAYFRSDKVACAAIRAITRWCCSKATRRTTPLASISNPEDFDAVGAALEAPAVRPSRQRKNASAPHQGVHRLADPTGNKIEILARPYHTGMRYFPARDAGITHFSHIGLNSTDAPRDENSGPNLQCAGLRLARRLALLRIATLSPFDRAVSLNRTGIQHINHQVEDLDDVMKSVLFPQGERT